MSLYGLTSRKDILKRLLPATSVAAVLFIAAPAVFAGNDTGGLNVTATVISICRNISTDNIDFGDYDPTEPVDNTNGQGSGTFSCTKGTNYRTYIARTNFMTNGTDSLTYELYSNREMSSVYPETADGTAFTAASNTPVTEDIYGTVAALQNAQPAATPRRLPSPLNINGKIPCCGKLA